MVAVIMFAVVLGLGFLQKSANDQDAEAARRSQATIEHVLRERWAMLGRALQDYTSSGEAYVNLHVAFSKEWAHDKADLDSMLNQRCGVGLVLLMGPDDQPRYAAVDGEVRDPAQTLATTDGALQALIRKAREAGAGDHTAVRTAAAMIAGQPMLVAAAALSTGGDPAIKPAPGPASVLVFAQELTPALLASVGDDYFIEDLHVARTKEDAQLSPAHRLTTETGDTAFVLRWTPDQPGSRLVTRLWPSLGGLVAALLIAIGVILRRSARVENLVAVSARKLEQAYKDVERQALHDSTTSLPNRTMLARHVERIAAQSGGRFTMLFLDLDRFKPVNDAHGHAAGDQVLRVVARRLTNSVGPSNLVARVGGDEFAAVILETDRAQVEKLCAALIDYIAEPIRHAGGESRIGLSIGVLTPPQTDGDFDELLRRADLALYRAKESGRGVYRFYEAEMSEQTLRRRELEGELWTALEHGEFFLEYQPRYDAETLRMKRVEALLRWRHPTRGLVGPGEFIELAEECGLILPIGDWAMRTACAQAAAWPGIGVSVNVSAVQVRNGGLVASTAEALAESGLDPERLEIELTEGVLLEDADRARAMLLELKTLGVRLSMDDFGTGFSSLGYLRSFPFDAIKIDKRFVADLGVSSDGRAIVQAILGLGRALGLSVTAEGVETREQLALLQLDRCQELQGFYLARPQAPESITALLEAEAGRYASLNAKVISV